MKAGAEFARKGFAQTVDGALENRRDPGDLGQRLAGRGGRKRIAFEDECSEFPPQVVGDRLRPVHAA